MWLTNANNQPIYDVVVRYQNTNANVELSWSAPIVPPEALNTPLEQLVTDVKKEVVEAVAAEQGLTYTAFDLDHVTAVGEALRERLPIVTEEWSRKGLSIEFRDVGGNVWQRSASGVLATVTAPGPPPAIRA